jgi:tetratricopeptide (TPR) repeat protein
MSNSRWRRYRPFLAGLVSGAVLVLAFLVPSVQEQWNLYRSSKVIDQYARIGRQLHAQGQYSAAEHAFDKAVEMSEGRRLDLIEAQLQAHVERVNENPEWRGSVPEDLADGDFLYLLAMQSDPARVHDRAATLAAFGAWLASVARPAEAAQRLDEALRLDPRNVAAHVNLGNLHDDRGDRAGAEAEYRRALALSEENPAALYDLGVLLLESGRAPEAKTLLRRYAALKPDDAEAARRLREAEASGP